jgi:hypothetical protein
VRWTAASILYTRSILPAANEEFAALQDRLSAPEDSMVLRKTKRAEQKQKGASLAEVKREFAICHRHFSASLDLPISRS